MDLNHPLAGKTLRFEVRIEGVRAATLKEQAQGLAGQAPPDTPGR